MVFGVMVRRMSLWWKFKRLDRTYQPLLEKALAFGNRDTLLKLEEQYWYQTAYLLEERPWLEDKTASSIELKMGKRRVSSTN